MRIVRYFFVGGAAAIIDIILFSLFCVYFDWPWLSVSVGTFFFATLVNYFLSICFVFESGIRHKKHFELMGVFLVSSLALIINQVALYIAIEVLSLNLIFSKTIASGIVFFGNYFGRKKFIF